MSDFWDREVFDRQHVPWMGIIEIREYLNTLIGGDERLWPIEWFEKWLGQRRFERALSIGCGAGELERQLVRQGIVQTIDAFDGSMASLYVARREADAAGVGDRIHYFAANFNHPVFPRRRYDIVFFHQSAHHVRELERVYRAVLRALKPNGLIYLDEYVGPSRFEWRHDLIAAQRAEFAAIDPALRLRDDLPYPIQADDPTEAVRSSDIEPKLRIGFDVLARRPYGGTLLALVVPQLRAELLSRDHVLRLVDRERALLAGGMRSYYAVIVARPKHGLARLAAWLRYYVAQKMRDRNAR